jgi:two-component system response regulator NreC
MSALNILLADDHTLVRQGIRKILEEQPDWKVVDEAEDGREAVQKTIAAEPDVLVIDVSMPKLNGIDSIRQVTRKVPRTKVLVLSMHADEAYVSQAVEAGAQGYLLKDSADVDLVRAVQAVATGKSFFSPAVAGMMLDDYRRRLAGKTVVDRYATLTEREREILQLLAEGRSNREVAELLFLSPATVETHRAHILQKLDVHNTAELVLYAVRRGIIA